MQYNLFFFQTPDKSNLFTIPQLAKELGFLCIQPPMSDHVKCKDLLVACEFFLLSAISKLWLICKSSMLFFKLLWILWEGSACGEQRDQIMSQVVSYKGFKTMEIMKPSPQKVITVFYKRRWFMKGSNYRALTRNKNYCYFKVVWIADHLWKVVSYERYLVTYKLLL